MNTLTKRTNGNGNLPATSFSGIVDRIFQDNLSRFFDDSFWGFNGLNHNVGVPVNLKETDKTYELEVVAPGLKKDDFRVDLQDDMLTVSFDLQQQQEEQSKEEGWLRREYRMQSFSRSFHLDDTIEADKISAQYRDGILYLQLPKKEGAQRISKTIAIS